MKVFVIHSNKDNEEIEEYLQLIRSSCEGAEILILKDPTRKLWRMEARKKMRNADCCLFFVGSDSHTSKNINWEIKNALRLGKPIYTKKLDPSFVYNERLYRKNTFGNVEYIDKSRYMYSQEVDIPTFCEMLANNLELDITKDIATGNKMSESAIMDQYKTYLKTSEDLVQRRQAASNFYISVNSILISTMSAIIAVINALKINYAGYISIGISAMLVCVGMVLCFNWRRIIMSYGKLNAAKMKVISALERQLPFNLYDIEWKVQTYNYNSEKKKYISFTSIEKRIPTVFIILYSIIFVTACVLLAIVLCQPPA